MDGPYINKRDILLFYKEETVFSYLSAELLEMKQFAAEMILNLAEKISGVHIYGCYTSKIFAKNQKA